jgi:plastocyanin
MKKFFTALSLLVVFLPVKFAGAATFTVTNSGFTFSPSTLTITVGDEVNFVLESIHTAVEVSKATWDANGTTSNGGFSTPFGGGKVTFNTAGTYYYVCSVHASSGMKGQIIVTNVTGLKQNSMNGTSLSVYPNPAGPYFTLKFSLSGSSTVNIDLLDLSGRRVKNLVSSVFTRGDWTQVFPSDGLVPGMYFIRYTRGGKTETANLIIEN